MALGATIYKVELQVSDMDRHYSATHALTLARHRNLTVLEIPVSTVAELAAPLQRGIRLQCLIQDGQLQLMNDADAAAVDPVVHMALPETVS